jgi:transcriptional regulator with XRE-family HTH domain
MQIGARLRTLREEKKLSQGDIEARTGLLRCYISRVENGHTVPALETLEKIARALDMPMYQFMYDGDQPPALISLPNSSRKELLWGDSRLETRRLQKLIGHLATMKERDRQLLIAMAGHAARRGSSRKTNGMAKLIGR